MATPADKLQRAIEQSRSRQNAEEDRENNAPAVSTNQKLQRAMELSRQRQQAEAQPAPAQPTPPDVIETRRRDEQFGFPGAAGPAPSDLERGRAPDAFQAPVGTPNDAVSQFLRGVTDTAALGSDLAMMPAQTAGRAMGVDVPGAPSGQDIAERSGGLIATEDPDTLLGKSARFGGAASGAAVPVGSVSGLVSRSAATGGGLIRRFFRGTRNLIAEGGQAFRQSPGRFVAEEGAAGAGAGAGGFFTEQAFPDSDAAQVVGELAGGLATQARPLVRMAQRGGQMGREAMQQKFGQQGGRRRAAEAVQGTQMRSEQGQMGRNLDEPTTVDPETGQPVLTPPQRTDSPGNLALERSVRESTPQMAQERQGQMARANRVLQDEARDIGAGGTPEDMSAAIEEGQGRLQQVFNERLRRTGQRIDQRIARLGQGATREQANRIAREEVENALQMARQQEDQLFDRVDMDVAVPSQSAQEALSRWRGQLGRAQMKNIPQDARSLLNPEAQNFVGEETTIREMRGLQQQLREDARVARSNNRMTKAAIADDIADAITEDIAAAGEQSEALQEAIGFSRSVKQRFRRGAVGKILGRDAAGGQAVAPGETLEATIGGGGPSQREALDQIRGALEDPEIAQRTGSDAAAFNEAANQYMRQLFLRNAVRNGEFNASAAQNFMRQNDELLGRMPEVRSELEQAVREGNAQRIVANRRSRTRLNDPSVSRATLFVRKGPQKAFSEIMDDAPDRAARQVQQLVNRAQRDSSGQATAGLKRGYVDFLMKGENQRDVAGERVIDGLQLRERRQNPSVQAAERRLLSQAERERLDTITSDLVRLQRSRETPSMGQLSQLDEPSKIRQYLARIAGASAGRTGASAMGVGGTVQIPGQVANLFNDMSNAGFEDPAGMLLRAGVDDERIWRDLLEAEVGPDGELPEKARNRLNAWVAGVMAEHQQGSEETLDEGDGGQR